MMRTSDMQTRHPVMSCPVCDETIHADVTVKPNLGTAVVAADGKSVDVPVEAEMTRFSLSHHCKGRVYAKADGAPEEGEV